MKPFLKWPGNKYRVLSYIKKRMPQRRTLIEPFVGSGAVFLNTDYKRYILNDINPDLINMYNCIKHTGTDFIDDLRPFFKSSMNNERKYYQIRERFNISQDVYEKSLLFIYLNRTGYNGLVRYAQKSKNFNVPFGSYKKRYFPEDEIAHFYDKSHQAMFLCGDFSISLSRARSNSVVYCDSPFVPLSPSSNFTQYYSTKFTKDDQRRLVDSAEQARERGAVIIISNHDTPESRKLYRGAKRSYHQVTRNISCKTDSRRPVREVLAIYQ